MANVEKSLTENEKQAVLRLRHTWQTIDRAHDSLIYRSAGIAFGVTAVGFILAALIGAGWLVWLAGLASIMYYLYASLPASLRKRVYDRHMQLVWKANSLTHSYNDLATTWRNEGFQHFLTIYAWEDDESIWGMLAAALAIVDAGQQIVAFRNNVLPAFESKKREAEAQLTAHAPKAVR